MDWGYSNKLKIHKPFLVVTHQLNHTCWKCLIKINLRIETFSFYWFYNCFVLLFVTFFFFFINGTKIRLFHFQSVKCLHTARTFYEADILCRSLECWLVEGTLYHCSYKIFAHNIRRIFFDVIQIERSHQIPHPYTGRN